MALCTGRPSRALRKSHRQRCRCSHSRPGGQRCVGRTRDSERAGRRVPGAALGRRQSGDRVGARRRCHHARRPAIAALARHAGLEGFVVPKFEMPSQCASWSKPVMALIETPSGVVDAARIMMAARGGSAWHCTRPRGPIDGPRRDAGPRVDALRLIRSGDGCECCGRQGLCLPRQRRRVQRSCGMAHSSRSRPPHRRSRQTVNPPCTGRPRPRRVQSDRPRT